MQIRILCGVEHDDLKTLFNVSNSIRAAVSYCNLKFWFLLILVLEFKKFVVIRVLFC